MLGNFGNLFVNCMRQVTKGHLYHLLGVSDYYAAYRHRAKSGFCETSVKITNWVTDLLRLFCHIFNDFVKSLWLEGGNFDVSPK